MKIEAIAEALRALADPTRLRVLHALFIEQEADWPVSRLVATLRLPQPTVSRHLATLRTAGLVSISARGRERLYRLADHQGPLDAALLSALEAFVSASPEAMEDRARIAAERKSLPAPNAYAIKEFHDETSEKEGATGSEAAMDLIFAALSHPTRRRILDRVGRRPGLTLGVLASGFETTRPAVTQHVGALERAGLLHSIRSGRERRLYADAVPVQLVYDRFTTRFTAPLAAHVAAVKYAAEESP